MKKISIKNFQIYGSEIKKDINLDFTKSKVIITGNNGVGKSSIINLIFSLMTNMNGLTGHVRHDGITIYDDDKNYKIHTNKSFNRLEEIKGEEREKVSRIISHLMISLGAISSMAAYAKNLELVALVKEVSKHKTTEGFSKLVNFVKTKNLGPIIESNELIQLTISGQLKNIRIKNEILQTTNRLGSCINSINSTINTYRNTNKNIQLANFQMEYSKNIEYISIFRSAEEYLSNNSYSRNAVNPNNQILINYELLKPTVDIIIKEINDDVLNVVNNFKIDFFNNVAHNADANAPDNYDFLDDLTALSNDESFSEAKKMINTNPRYKDMIGKYFAPLAKHGAEYKRRKDDLDNFLHAFNRALNDDKEIIMDGANIMFKHGDITKPLNISDLSAGEKQMFKMLRVLHLSDKRILILDEPEISLSILWQQILRESIDNFSKVRGNNVLMVTHSPYMILNNDMREENKIIVSL